MFDEAFARHFSSSSPTSHVRVTLNDEDETSNTEILDETVSLDPKGDSRRTTMTTIGPHGDSRMMNSYACDMDMDTYQAELAEATNALLVAEKCKYKAVVGISFGLIHTLIEFFLTVEILGFESWPYRVLLVLMLMYY